jgi:hypothetical protein
MPRGKAKAPLAKRARFDGSTAHDGDGGITLEASLLAEDVAMMAESELNAEADGAGSEEERLDSADGDSLTEQLARVLRALQTARDRKGLTLSEIGAITGIVSEMRQVCTFTVRSWKLKLW